MTDNTSMNILVAGGAGYIGSVTTAMLVEAGHTVTVLDNLSKGHRDAIHPDARFVEGDIGDPQAVTAVCRNGIDLAMHFAAFIEVGESVTDPRKYYRNNVIEALRFIDALIDNGVGMFVFSSTAAVYGQPREVPLTEDSPLAPINPYGWTKRMIEQALVDYSVAHDFRAAALRYFNAGGAYGQYGENHDPESHLIPRILNMLTDGGSFSVFGDDYDTPDGSCIRDYIHVRDLADAHVRAAGYLADGGTTDAFNLGTGTGYSVFEVIKTVEHVTGKEVPFTVSPRRPGDPPRLVASPERGQRILGRDAHTFTLEDIVASAWEWKLTHPQGYER